MLENELLLLVYLGAIVCWVFIIERFVNSIAGFCMKCRRFSAMQFTGVVDLRAGNEEWVEYHCKFCDVSHWRIRRKGAASGGGVDVDGCASGGCGGGCGGG